MSPDDRSTGIALPAPLDRRLSRLDDLPLVPSFVAGIGAFVGGYVTFVALLAASGNPNFGTPLRTLRQIGSLYYNAQNVPLISYREIALGDTAIPEQVSINIIQQYPTSLPRIAYYAIPVAAIAVVAAILASRYLDRTRPIETAVAVVGGTTLGYVLSAVVGAFLVAQQVALESSFATLTPSKPWTFAFGIAYPLVVTALVVAVVLALDHVRGTPTADANDSQA